MCNWLYSLQTHYSKSQIYVQKFNFDKTPTFSRVFYPTFFWQFFSCNQSCKQLKRPKPQHFHEFFTQKNRQFSRKIKVGFLDKKWRFRTVCKAGNFFFVCIFLKKLWFRMYEGVTVKILEIYWVIFRSFLAKTRTDVLSKKK